VGHVARMGREKGHIGFMANKSERKNPIIIHRSGWMNDIKLNLQKD